MEGVRPELSDLRGLRIFAAFLFVGDVENVDKLIRDLQSRTSGPRLIYLTSSVTPLRVVHDSTPDPDGRRPVPRSIMDENDSNGRDWPG
jgi:hypothetical protein